MLGLQCVRITECGGVAMWALGRLWCGQVVVWSCGMLGLQCVGLTECGGVYKGVTVWENCGIWESRR